MASDSFSDICFDWLTLAALQTVRCECFMMQWHKPTCAVIYHLTFHLVAPIFFSYTCPIQSNAVSKSISFKMARAWSDGSLLNLTTPSNWILSNSNLVVIADKYPKAKFHYLVLPRQKISSIFEVSNFSINILCAPDT